MNTLIHIIEYMRIKKTKIRELATTFKKQNKSTRQVEKIDPFGHDDSGSVAM